MGSTVAQNVGRTMQACSIQLTKFDRGPGTCESDILILCVLVVSSLNKGKMDCDDLSIKTQDLSLLTGHRL